MSSSRFVSTLCASVALLAAGTAQAAATKDDAVSMVKKGVVFMKSIGRCRDLV